MSLKIYKFFNEVNSLHLKLYIIVKVPLVTEYLTQGSNEMHQLFIPTTHTCIQNRKYTLFMVSYGIFC